VPGQRQEHVIEGRPPDADVVDDDPCLRQRADHLDERLRAARGRQRQLAGVGVDHGVLDSEWPDEPSGTFRVRAFVDHDLDALATDLRLELIRGAAGDDLAVVDDGDGVGQLVRLFQVLGCQQQCRALTNQCPDDLPHAQSTAWIKPRRGLVQEQQSGPTDEGTREVQPAPHAAGVGLDDPTTGLHEVELLQQLPGTRACLLAGQLVQPPEHPQVLLSGQVLVDGRVLAGEPDDRSQLLRVRDHIESGYGGASGVRLQQRRQDAHRGGLAGTIRAEQAQDAAFFDFEVDAVQRTDLALA